MPPKRHKQPPESVLSFGARLTSYINENHNGQPRVLAKKLAAVADASASLRERLKWERAKSESARIRNFEALISRWRAGASEPSAGHIRRLCEVTQVSADHWLYDDRPRYPWQPRDWNDEMSRHFGQYFFRSSASQILDEPENRANLETLARLTDAVALTADHTQLADYDARENIVIAVEKNAGAWLAEAFMRIREHVDREIAARIARHLAAGRLAPIASAPKRRLSSPPASEPVHDLRRDAYDQAIARAVEKRTRKPRGK